MGAEFYRYLVAGVINTAVGYLVFLVLLHLFDMSALVSNAASYAVGLMVAYVLNLVFVFRESRHSSKALVRFLAGFAIAYAINATVLMLALKALGLRAEIGQLFAMGAYTVSFYLINKHFIWRQG